MAFIKRLNHNPNGTLVSDEVITLANGAKSHKFSHNNVMENKGVSVWTSKNSTGTKITDFVISNNSNKSWVQEIKFGNAVSNGTYYVTYYSEGDESDADDINQLGKAIEVNKERLAVRYVHKGNKVIKPVSVNLTTGLFTTDEVITLPIGSNVNVLTNYPAEHPSVLFSEWNGTNSYSLRVVSDKTFYITFSGNIITYASSANNLSVNVKLITFEYDFIKPTIDLSNLNMGDEFRIVLTGVRDRPSWSYTPLSFYTDSGYVSGLVDMGSVDGRDFMYLYAEKIYKYNPDTGIFVSIGGRTAVKQWSGGTSWQFNSNLDATRSFDSYRGFKIDRVNVLFNIGNNFVVEIYTINKDV